MQYFIYFSKCFKSRYVRGMLGVSDVVAFRVHFRPDRGWPAEFV